MQLVNLATGRIEEVPARIDATDNPGLNMQFMLDHGWRQLPVIAEPAAGFERLVQPSYMEGDGITAQAVYHDTLIQDRKDREAADAAHKAEHAAQRKATADLKAATIAELRAKYIATTHQLCAVCGITQQDKLDVPDIEAAVQSVNVAAIQGGIDNRIAVTQLCIALDIIITDLRRIDGDNAWDKIVAVTETPEEEPT